MSPGVTCGTSLVYNFSLGQNNARDGESPSMTSGGESLVYNPLALVCGLSHTALVEEPHEKNRLPSRSCFGRATTLSIFIIVPKVRIANFGVKILRITSNSLGDYTMPIKRCTVTEDGVKKNGWQYGESGKCFVGSGAKKKAIKQGLAIQYNGGPKFESRKKAKSDAELEFLAGTLISRREELTDDVQRTLLDNRDRKLAVGKS